MDKFQIQNVLLKLKYKQRKGTFMKGKLIICDQRKYLALLELNSINNIINYKKITEN